MINQRLFDQYGIDTRKDLSITKHCPRPYDTILIDKKGSCYACECTAWLPQSIGNLQVRDLADIIDSDMHRHLQGAIEDGTYRYCNNSQCSWLTARDFSCFEVGVPEDRVKQLRLAIDDSCNLRCPSCRNDMIFHKEGSAYRLGIRLADRVNEWLGQQQHRIKVHIGSDGDPFASLVYRHFMRNTPDRQNITYSILTNGLMLRDFHSSVPHVISKMDTLGISIDGATQGTYEKLRLGGRWDKIVDALECAKDLKQANGHKFNMHMVVQQDNWHEMELMVALGAKYNADTVFLNPIEDWNTGVDMSRQTFRHEDGFKRMAERLSINPIVWVNLPR